MFDRFTERARKVMTLSRIEAQKFGHDCIGCPHVLLGIVEEGNGVAAEVLKNLGADPAAVRAAVEKQVKRGNHRTTGNQLPFTPGSKHLLEFALEEALALGHNYIGTEHLLLGLLRERKEPGAGILEGLGVGIERVREEVLRLLRQGPPAVLPAVRLQPAPGGTPVDLPSSPTAEAVLDFARKEAARLRNDYLGTEHLLLGLVGAGCGAAGQVLRDLGMSLARVRAEVDRLVERGTVPVDESALPITPRMVRIVANAKEEAREGGHDRVAAEHLLLALVREEDGPAAHVFQNLGVPTASVRERVVEALAAGRTSGPAPTEEQKRNASALAAEAAAAVAAAIPDETVQVSALFHSSNLGFGHHLLLLWREGPGEPILASVTAVAWNAESVRAEIPGLVESLRRIIGREKAES